MIDFLIRALATGFFLSYLPYRLMKGKHFTGSGLVGSLWGVALLPLLPEHWSTEALTLAAVLLASVYIGGRAEKLIGQTDDPRIVIDEFIGYWITIAFLPRTIPILIGGFILFRIFDVTKPGPIRRLGELPGGWGVVMDDVLAGVFSNLLLQIATRVHVF